MAASRIPGPICVLRRPLADEGTTARASAPLPGPVSGNLEEITDNVPSTAFFLRALGTPRVTEPRRARLKLAIDFLANPSYGLSTEMVLGYLRGIDFSSPVQQVTLAPRRDVLIQHSQVPLERLERNPGELGCWFTKARVTPDKLGVSEGAPASQGGKPLEKRRPVHCILLRECQALLSRAAAAKDFWTRGMPSGATPFSAGRDRDDALRRGVLTQGGAEQYFIHRADVLACVRVRAG